MNHNMVVIPDIHIGGKISEYLQENRLTQAELARYTDINPANLNKLLKRKSMDTDRLIDISLSLAHNFFSYWSRDPNKDQGVSITVEKPESIGKLIDDRLRELNMTQREFASQLGVTQPEINRLIKKTSFDTDKLATISRILNHNFFTEFYYRVEIPSNEEQEAHHFAYILQRVEELTRENEHLKYELEQVKAENIALKEQLNK